MITSEAVFGFSEGFLKAGYDKPKPTPAFHHYLWDLCCLDKKYVAIAAPRGHAKSTAVTHAFTLACVCFRVKSHVMIVSDTESQSVNFLGDIKKEFLENDELIEVFGIKKLIKDSETEVIVQFEDGNVARLIAKGSEQKLRGTKWRGKRPDLIICDDLENDEIVMNEERRAKFRRWFYNALLPCGSDDVWVRVVGTILHMDSLLSRLTPQEDDQFSVVEPLRIQTKDPNNVWHAVTFRAHPNTNDFKYLLWREKWPEERLREERQHYLNEGYVEGYAQEYLNKPIDDSKAFYKREYFKPLDPDWKQEYHAYYITADLAISEKDSRAYSVLVVGGLNHLGTLRIVDIRRFRGDAYDIISEMIGLCKQYKPDLVGIEQENIAKSIGPVLYAEAHKARVDLNVHEFKPITDKLQRGRSLQFLMRAGRVEFDVDASWYHDMFQELVYFPRGRYMDQADALAWMGIMIRDMVEAPTITDVEQAQYLREYSETYEDWDEFFVDDMETDAWGNPFSGQQQVSDWTGY